MSAKKEDGRENMSVKEAPTENGFAVDLIQRAETKVKITMIGHGTLILSYEGKVIHVDPWSRLADYSKMPKADLILITHEHRDHLDPQAVKLISREGSDILLSSSCTDSLSTGIVIKNGDVKEVQGIRIEAVPAYNIVNKRSSGEPYHPKGRGNGYILTLGEMRVYIAGDTENTPEMKELKNIDVAFLPMNLPYTMTPEMVADAASAFKPKVLYPYHFGQTDTSKLIDLLKDFQDIKIRIHNMQ
ncbi:MAG: MBL fold metallo-hydrolase [Sedimentisphaerales bacterium]|nr:MBL fold metallo-hydrolase [Sedimentisphaerales bacterium]